MRRGISNDHVLDLKLDFRFVNRGGEYVYEVWNHDQTLMFGTAKIRMEELKVTSFSIDTSNGEPLPPPPADESAPEQLELDLQGGGR